jgi:hypothetical protein
MIIFSNLADRLSFLIKESGVFQNLAPSEEKLSPDMFKTFDDYRSVQKELIKELNQPKIDSAGLKDAIEDVERAFNTFKWQVRPVLYRGAEKYIY